MESENKPLLIWPSRTPKSIPKKNVGPKSFPSIPASTWFFCVTFDVLLQKLCTVFTKSLKLRREMCQNMLRTVSGILYHVFIMHLPIVLSWRHFLYKMCTIFAKAHQKSHKKTTCWWEQKGNTWDQNSFWELIQGSQRAKLAGVHFQIQFLTPP